MNTVLDVLRLRRVRLDYVSPPVCEVIFSGSGSSLMLEAVGLPAAPFDLRFSGQCERFLTWSTPTPVACVSLYSAINPLDPLTRYVLEADCVPTGYASVCSPGLWQYSTLTPDGTESARSTPVRVEVGERVNIPIVKPAGAVRFNLFRNPDITNPAGSFALVFSTVSAGTFEVCDPTGCYRLQAISADGASELSVPICSAIPVGCIPDTFQEILCPEPGVCLGVAYSSQFEAVGGTEPYTWELISGSAPAGITIHTGLFSGNTAPINGTPTEAGVFSFTVKSTSASGTFQEKSCTLSVLGVVEYGAVPDGTTDTAYSEQLTAAGGVPPYSFSLTAGSLPSGYSMDAAGLITGTTNFIATSNFTVEITDALGATCSTPLVLEVTGCPTPASYPTISWPTVTGTTWATMMIFDSTRRNLLVQLSNFNAVPGVTMGIDEVSSISKAYANEYLDSGTGNTFGTGWMGYDPVNDLVGIASREVLGVRYWTRFNPATGAFTSAGVQSIAIGQDNILQRLAVDTTRGHLMGTRQTQYELVEITASTFTSLSVDDPVPGTNLWHCCYNEVSDRFVLLLDGTNPPIVYVDPATYAVTLSTVNQTQGGSPRQQIYSLPGTPWVAFVNSGSFLVIVDTTDDTVYWNPAEIIGVQAPPTPAPAIGDFSYNPCSGVLTISTDSFINQYNVLTKTYVGRSNGPGGNSVTFMEFDSSANLTYLLKADSPAASHEIRTL